MFRSGSRGGAARARVGLAGNELSLRAADLFVGLQAAHEKAAILEESFAEIERAVAIVSGRLESGAASRCDLTRVEVELAGMNARLADARAELAEDAYRLGRGSLLELTDAARSRLDARLTEVDLRAATVGQELRILGLTGKLGG